MKKKLLNRLTTLYPEDMKKKSGKVLKEYEVIQKIFAKNCLLYFLKKSWYNSRNV